MLSVCILGLSSFSMDDLILGTHDLAWSITQDEIREAAVSVNNILEVTFHLLEVLIGVIQ